jgi:hypothetical protein
MERLKEPEEYLDLFLYVKKGRVTAKDALRIEKKESSPLSGSGWYELHPFGTDLGTWNANEDALRDVDIDAWNAKAHELVSGIRASGRKNVLFLCAVFGPALLIAGVLQNNLSFGASGVFFLVVAAMLWRQAAAARKARRL